MKKTFSLLIVLSFIVLLLSGCSQQPKSESKTVNNLNQSDGKGGGITSPRFAIYMVKDTDYFKVNPNNLNEISLEKEPIITEKDIISYDWNVSNNNNFYKYAKSISSLTLKNGVTIGERMKMQGYKSSGVNPFILTVDNSRVFLGTFYFVATSVGVSKYIYISSPLGMGDENLVQLYDTSEKDLIHDKRIYNALKSYGILKE
jgi:hypothetical protein